MAASLHLPSALSLVQVRMAFFAAISADTLLPQNKSLRELRASATQLSEKAVTLLQPLAPALLHLASAPCLASPAEVSGMTQYSLAWASSVATAPYSASA